MREFVCVYQDPRHQRFFVLATLDDRQLHFCHWRELQPHGLTGVAAGQVLQMDAAEPPETFVSRGLRVATPPGLRAGGSASSLAVVADRDFTGSRLAELEALLGDDSDQPLVLVGCRIGMLEWRGLHTSRHLAFLDCHFTDHARFVACRFDRSVWFCNSRFNKHFSLKSCEIAGDVHLEACDFSGEGGISCRGLVARNCFLDLGVRGGADITWLNEMQVTGVLSVGGEFPAPLQLLSEQDAVEPATRRRHIGSIEMGREVYGNEQANATRFAGGVVIDGYSVGELRARRVEFDSLSVRDLHCDAAVLREVTVAKNLSIADTRFTTGLELERSSVYGHLRLEDLELGGVLSLRESSVAEIAYLDAPKFRGGAQLDLHRFSCARFLLTPPGLLLAGSRFRPFSARRFALLKPQQDAVRMGDQYCSLKHWLADAGQLDLEDTAFFCMRDCYSRNRFSRFLFGRVFGWGVRLTNIAASGLLLVLVYAALYFALSPELGWVGALVLSKQAFIGAFFGATDAYGLSHSLSVLVTTEALLGVLFVTVFVGAYIRKLLR